MIIVPNVNSPPRDCPIDNQIWLTEQSPFDVTFSASSYVSSFVSDDSIRLRRTSTMLTWRPSPDDPEPWVEIQLEQPEPIYGIIVGGDAFEDIFVTSYHVIFSEDGHTFSTLGNGEALRGPADSNEPVKQIFQTGIEAKIVRVYPVTWHEGIAMQIELIGCGQEETTTTAAPIFTTPIYTETIARPGILNFFRLIILYRF